jgi:hypothetical protein
MAKCVILHSHFLILKKVKMRSNANYLILPELRLILECCKGEASVEDAVMMKMDEMADPLYSKDYDILVDFQEFETFLNISTSETISNFHNFLKEIEISGKAAFLTTKPHQVVIGEKLKRLTSESLTIKIETFSTIEAAIRFLGHSTDNLDIISSRISELNKNTA